MSTFLLSKKWINTVIVLYSSIYCNQIIIFLNLIFIVYLFVLFSHFTLKTPGLEVPRNWNIDLIYLWQS